MASGLVFTLLLCLSCGLWAGTIAQCARRVPACSCPSGWNQNDKRCFLFVDTQTDWASAERTCIGMGANLASIHNVGEHTYLKNLVNSKKGNYARTWIGGNDAVKDGVWMWSDGSRLSYISWGTGEPNNNGGQESCLEINIRGATRWMNDERCTTRNYFICAKNL